MRIRSAIRTVTIAGVLATGSPSAQISTPSIVVPAAPSADWADLPDAGVQAALGVVLLTLATIRRPR